VKQKSRARTNGSQNLERILRKSQPAPPLPGILQESFKNPSKNTTSILALSKKKKKNQGIFKQNNSNSNNSNNNGASFKRIWKRISEKRGFV